jgi:rhodanese-related sulfurtransferase
LSKHLAISTEFIFHFHMQGYYPGASQIHLKLVFCPTSGRIYGAQAVGKDGVDKRIDVIATAMQGSLTVHDLSELELCYAPPVGSAKDPVNYAGMVASNIVDGLVSSIGWSEFQDQLLHPENSLFVLDVRNPEEITKTGSVAPASVNIPLNELRDRLHEVPRDGRRIVVSCMSGQRAYYACRILLQNGYAPQSIAYLSGSYLTLHAAIHQSSRRCEL